MILIFQEKKSLFLCFADRFKEILFVVNIEMIKKTHVALGKYTNFSINEKITKLKHCMSLFTEISLNKINY